MPNAHRYALAALASAALLAPAGPAAAAPRAIGLSGAWEARDRPGDPSAAQPPPPEGDAGSEEVSGPAAPPTRDPTQVYSWRSSSVPSVFDTRAHPRLYPGQVREYRLSFRGPRTPPGFRWQFVFESVRRGANVYLNGRLIARNRDPYTPFRAEARGLRPGAQNELVVMVDSRKDPRIPEGWWNWGGIVRPVRLVPVGTAHLANLGTMSRVSCTGPARGCRASLLLDGVLERRGARRIAPVLDVRLRAPGGRITRKRFRLPRQRRGRRRLQLEVPVRAPQLWSPDDPRLYSASFTLRDRRRGVQQVVRRTIGLRSVEVKGGELYLNNRRLYLRGASIHEDMPGSGAALTDADMDRIVRDLKELGANVTRAHYLLNERLLRRLDRAGIMVWSQAPIWQRDHRANLLQYVAQRVRARSTVRRSVLAARSHPSVITHSVANELAFQPDLMAGSALFLSGAARDARNLDPTVPISYDAKGRPGVPEQFVYQSFDMIGVNTYFGWYSGVSNFDDFEPYLAELREVYPRHALVVTEFGAEARPELAAAPPEQKGGYPFQASLVSRTQEVIDRTPWLSGSIYWTLREFEIFPGWTGGAGRRPPQYEPNTRHHKGLLTYDGVKKPAWHVLHDRYSQTPLFAARRR
jgi:beta-galactosidase/beta-glucuronidase